MRAILMSIQARHNRNIESGAKTSELRTKPPKIELPFKVYTYESGFDGRHNVVNEWICRDITEWRICMGIPAHLPLRACVEPWEIKEYSGKDYKDISEMRISDLVIYDKSKDLSEFVRPLDRANCGYKDCGSYDCGRCALTEHICEKRKIKLPPQSWCFAEVLRI